jgi:hypothetical protein
MGRGNRSRSDVSKLREVVFVIAGSDFEFVSDSRRAVALSQRVGFRVSGFS